MNRNKTKSATGISKYYRLTKPGIIRGNVMTALAGFLLASGGHVRWSLLAYTLTGIGLVIAAGCVLNNYIDRNIDKKMTRTRERALVTGVISGRVAISYGLVLGMIGLGLLWFKVNHLTAVLGISTLVFYDFIYGYFKRRSVHGTLVGSVAGSMSLVAGYTAVSGRLNREAVLLFIILAAWQMPHFFAISLRRFNDYKAAGLPVWPVKKGISSTKAQIFAYTLVFAASTTALSVYGYTGWTFMIVMGLVSLYWLKLAFDGLKAEDYARFGSKMFFFSLAVLLLLSAMLSIDAFLP